MDICFGIHYALHNLTPVKLLSCWSVLISVRHNWFWPLWVVFAGNELFSDFAAAFLECQIGSWLGSSLLSALSAKGPWPDKLKKGKALPTTVSWYAETIRSDACCFILEEKVLHCLSVLYRQNCLYLGTSILQAVTIRTNQTRQYICMSFTDPWFPWAT